MPLEADGRKSKHGFLRMGCEERKNASATCSAAMWKDA